MSKRKIARRIGEILIITGLLTGSVYASTSTAYLTASDNYVNTASVRAVATSGADSVVTFYGSVYSTSKNNATFGVYFLNSTGNWVLSSGYVYTKKPGESLGSTVCYGSGTYAYLKIVSGNDMLGYLNKNTIAEGTINGD